jgi:diguanylate cyclase (GGDEF)-like protein/PAS domain S-box-containing protein
MHKLIFDDLLNQVNDTVIVAQEATGIIVDCNDQACRSLGYTRDELLRLTIFDIASTIAPGQAWESEREIFARDGYRLVETHHRRRDGSLFPVEINARLTQKDNERFIVAVARDLTARNFSESQLRLQDAALNSTANAIVITDKDGIIEWANPAFACMTGYAIEEALGKRPKELVKSSIQTREFYEILWNTILSGNVWHGEVVNKRKDGTFYTEEMAIAPVYAENKIITHFIAVKQDISARKAAELKVEQSELTYRGIINSLTEAVYILNEKGEFIDVNHGAEMMYGYSREEFLGTTPAFVSAPGKNDLSAVMDAVQKASSGITQQIEFWGKRKDGSIFPKSVSLVRGDYFGQAVVIAVSRDITIQKETEAHLREAAAVMQNTHEGVMITDASANLIAVNKAFTTITGYAVGEVIGMNPRLLSSGRQNKTFYETMWTELKKNGYWQGEMWNRRKSGEIYPQLLTISTIYNEQRQPTRHIGLFVDITQLRQNQAQLEFMAHHDPLTKLPNRALAESRLEQEIEQAHRHHRQLSVLFIDLDRFKQVNDSFGHLVGDELLVSVAQRLNERLREGDTLGRLGGDEFILIASPLQDKQDAAIIARDLINALSEPFMLSNGVEVFIGGSIGISLFPDNGISVADLTKNADAAMYLAKENGRNQFSFYTSELNADARNKLELENDLRRAVLQNELQLNFQPKVDIRTGAICGAEALARWQKPDNTWVSPYKFIPLAEKSGVILTIGNWVLEQTCAQIRSWLDAGLPPVCVAVNVSARQFRSGHLDKLVAAALDKSNIPPQCLELELTESILMHEPDNAIATMHKLKKVGVKLSLDDFGTGYSNFVYLRRFPIDSLKIDQSFVQGITTRAEDAMIVDSIIGLAQRMKLRVVGEGVESKEQLAYLSTRGCDELQGFLFSKALPADEFAALLKSGKQLNP